MRVKTFVLILAIMFLSAAYTAGTAWGQAPGRAGEPSVSASSSPAGAAAAESALPTTAVTGSNVATETPSAAPTPPPTPAPKPTPVPTAAPTPDPWAGMFSPEGPYLSVRDPDRGPWIYKDEALSITVTIPKAGRFAGKYLKADVYTRGPLPLCGFADKSAGRKTALPWKIARQNKAVLAITGDYLTCTYNRKGVMIRGGKVYYDKKDAPTVAFLPSGEMRVYEPGKVTAKELLALGVKDAFSFGPILVKGGKIHPSVAKHKLNYHAFRAAIGQAEPGHWVIIVTLRAPLLTELAQLFIDNKCSIAYNLDGGYSAAMVFMGNQLNKNFGDAAMQRALPEMLVIGQCNAVPGEKDPVYANGIRLDKRYRPKAVEGLIGK